MTVEPHPNGETVIRVRADEISPQAAAGIGTGLTRVKQRYQADGLLRCTAA